MASTPKQGPSGLIVRMRCGGKHAPKTSPWLPGLVVYYRQHVPPPEDGSAPEALPFQRCMTEANGYLVRDDDPATIGETPRLPAGVPHEFVLIRHPDQDVAIDTAHAFEKDGLPPGAEVLVATPQQQPTGKGAGKKQLAEGVVDVPVDPRYFLPRGSSNYGGFVLERDMHHVGCVEMEPHVARLQQHLGALRFLVGGSLSPYVPLPPGTKGYDFCEAGKFNVVTWSSLLRFQREAASGGLQLRTPVHAQLLDEQGALRPEILDDRERNMRVQYAYAIASFAPADPADPRLARLRADVDAARAAVEKVSVPLPPPPPPPPPAKGKKAKPVDPKVEAKARAKLEKERQGRIDAATHVLSRAETDLAAMEAGLAVSSGKTASPRAPTADEKAAVQAALDRVAADTGRKYTRSELLAAVPKHGVVDALTGAAIELWLAENRRRDGSLLLPVRAGEDEVTFYWLHERALAPFLGWSADARQHGFSAGIRLNHTYRDARVDVGHAGYGRAALSIHKTGFAFDLRMTGFTKTTAEFPALFARDARSSRASWKLFGLAKVPADVADDDRALYVSKVREWVYDAYHPDGGVDGPERSAGPGEAFVDLTKLALRHGFYPINSFAEGWFGVDAETVELKDAASFQRYVTKLGAWVSQFELQGGAVKALEDSLAAVDAELAKNPNEKKLADLTKRRTTLVEQLGVARTKRDVVGEGRVDPYAIKADNDTLSTWLKLVKAWGPTPEIRLDPANKKDAKLIAELRSKFAGRSVVALVPKAQNADGTIKYEETVLKVAKDAAFPTVPFELAPVTEYMPARRGGEYNFPHFFGQPIGMEWWHFQMCRHIEGQLWSDLLLDLGWTLDGLAGKDRPGPLDDFGLGYPQNQLAQGAAISQERALERGRDEKQNRTLLDEERKAQEAERKAQEEADRKAFSELVPPPPPPTKPKPKSTAHPKR